MNHVFSQEIAKKYGMQIAVLLQYLFQWTYKNLLQKRNIIDGYCWTFDTLDSIVNRTGYWKKYTIHRLLKRAERLGLVHIRNYNKSKYDRTLWYALTETGRSLFPQLDTEEIHKLLIPSILHNCKIDIAEMQNPYCENATPIPITNTITKPVCVLDTPSKEMRISENSTHTGIEILPVTTKKSEDPNGAPPALSCVISRENAFVPYSAKSEDSNEIKDFFQYYRKNELQGLWDANREEKTKRLRNECLNDESLRKLFHERLGTYCVEYEELLDECISWNENRDRPRHVDRYVFAQWIRTTNPAMKGWVKRTCSTSSSAASPFTKEEIELMQDRKAELRRPGLLILRSDLQREKADRLLAESSNYRNVTVNHRTVSQMPVSIKSLLGMRNVSANSSALSG